MPDVAAVRDDQLFPISSSLCNQIALQEDYPFCLRAHWCFCYMFLILVERTSILKRYNNVPAPCFYGLDALDLCSEGVIQILINIGVVRRLFIFLGFM